jgi:hypothetical protein
LNPQIPRNRLNPNDDRLLVIFRLEDLGRRAHERSRSMFSCWAA